MRVFRLTLASAIAFAFIFVLSSCAFFGLFLGPDELSFTSNGSDVSLKSNWEGAAFHDKNEETPDAEGYFACSWGASEGEQVIMNFPDDLVSAGNVLSGSNLTFFYNNQDGKLFVSSDSDPIRVTIASYKNEIIEGTFSGSLSSWDAGAIVVTNGEFRARVYATYKDYKL